MVALDLRNYLTPIEMRLAYAQRAEVLREIGAASRLRVQALGKVVVLADAARLRQGLDHLLSNAIERSPEGGTVTAVLSTGTQDDGEHARIDIIDEGPGVAPEILPRIFDRLATGKANAGLETSRDG